MPAAPRGKQRFSSDKCPFNTTMQVAHGSELYGTCYVCCAVGILCAAVEQQESFGLQRYVALWSRLVVYNGTMLLISCNSVKRVVAIQRLLSTQLAQLLAYRQLGLVAPRHSLLQPFQEANHSHTVAQHGSAIALTLSLALHSLHGRDGRRSAHHTIIATHMRESIVDCSRVDEQRVSAVSLQSLYYVIVFGNVHVLLLEISHHLRRQLFTFYI